MLISLTLGLLLASTSPAGASTARGSESDRTAAGDSGLRWFATVGYDYALGDRVEVLLADGTTAGFRPNGGFAGGLGLSFDLSPRGLLVRASIAIKQGALVSDGGNLRYRAFPVELLGAWRGGAVQVGAGVSLALRPSLGGSDSLSGLHADLERSLGLVGRVEWVRGASDSRLESSFGARVLWETLKTRGGGTVAAPAVGLFAGFSY